MKECCNNDCDQGRTCPNRVPSEDIVDNLRKRAEIRRQISTRKSVQEGKPDRIADLLEEAADMIVALRWALSLHTKD
jgi:archaellum component FlaD/FlaE